MQLSRLGWVLLAACLAMLVSRSSTWAQSAMMLQPYSVGYSGDDPFGEAMVVMESGVSVPTSVSPSTGDDAAAVDARKKARLAAIAKLKFDRRPSAILQAWADQAKQQNKAARATQQNEPEQKTAVDKVADATVADATATKASTADKSAANEATATDDPAADAAGDKSATNIQSAQVEVPPRPKRKADQKKNDAEKVAPDAAAKAQLEAKKAAEEAKAKAEELAQEQKKFDANLQELDTAVTLGQWSKLAEALQDREFVSIEEAVAIYDQLLKQLGTNVPMDFSQVEGLSAEMQTFMQSMMQNSRNNPAQAYAEKNSINFADLIGVLSAKPQALKDEQVEKLARLLSLTLSGGNQLNDFVASLKLGGDDLLPSQQVALLLSSAGQDKSTVDFLPAQAEAVASGNVQALNLIAKHYLALYRADQKESFRETAWDATLAVLAIELPDSTSSDDEPPVAADDTQAAEPSVAPNSSESTSAESTSAEKLAEEKAAALAAEKEAKAKLARAEQERSAALSRAVSLAPQVRSELGQKWLETSFRSNPELGQAILAKLGTSTAQLLAQTPQDASNRTQNLKLQHAAVEQLLNAQIELDDAWVGILNLLASNWLKEAEVARQYSRDSQYGPSMRRDSYGNIYYANPSDDPFGENEAPMRMGMIAPVKISDVLESSPSGRWFAAIDASIRPQYTLALCRLWLKINEDAKAFPFVEELSKSHPETARELAEEFLKVWTTNHNPNEQKQQTNYYMFIYGYEEKADKIPLTRSKQQRNLVELSQWLARIRKLPLDGKIDEKLLVRAFMTCHSVAEVYDIDDIEQVFGTWGEIEAGTMASLIQAMRTNLSGVWLDPNVQRDAKTNRKKVDIQAEVVQGYATAERVIDRALQQHPGAWQLLLAKACVMHDRNDFVQQAEPSSEFSARRQVAFDVFSDAAESYLRVAADLPEREQSNDVFDYWFYAALGATDLKAISEKNRPASEQFELIHAAMNRLEGQVGERHRDRFANALFTRMSAVSPACKFRYVDAGFKLVGENPQAAEARKVYDYYSDLVTELELVMRLDGDARIGHDEPFGVYVDLRHTVELERESGGFGKYLQNQNNAYYSYNYGRPTENYRDKFQDAATAALQDHFDVLSVTFNHAEVKSIAANKDGWRVTPYAYLLLKARGPEVDKIPALKLDMDFLDTSGYVVLPVSSAPVPIDASAEKKWLAMETGQTVSGLDSEQADAEQPGLPVALDDLRITQLLDERQFADGKLIVETKATARGLVPPMESVLNPKVEGFKLADVEDSGVSVIEFDKESTTPQILSERTWTLKYVAADPGAPTPDQFVFPSTLLATSAIGYQRYVDADLEEVEQVASLLADYGSNRRTWLVAGLLSVVGLAGIVGLIVLSRRQRTDMAGPQTITAELTPFTLLAKLQQTEQSGRLSAAERGQIVDDIAAIERAYFAQANGHHVTPDLSAIANRWQS